VDLLYKYVLLASHSVPRWQHSIKTY